MKILFLCPTGIHKRNWGHQLFRNEFGRQHDVVYYGRGFKGCNRSMMNAQDIINNRCKNKKPDIIMTYGAQCKEYTGIKQVKDVIKVHFLMDYQEPIRPEHIVFKNNINTHNKRVIDHGYDFVFTTTNMSLQTLRKSKIVDPKMTAVFPFSVNTNQYRDLKIFKTNDVMAIYTINPLYYPDRNKIRLMLNTMKLKVESRKIIKTEMIKAMNQCKIIITSNNYWKSLSMRYTETLACGGFLLADKPDDLELVGLKDGEHLVIYKDLNDLKRKIEYYLDPKHEKEREQIAANGMEFVRKNHNCKVRVQQVIKFIKSRKGIK